MHGFFNKQGGIVFGLVQDRCVVPGGAMVFIPGMFCYGRSTFSLHFIAAWCSLRRVSRLLFVSPMYVRSQFLFLCLFVCSNENYGRIVAKTSTFIQLFFGWNYGYWFYTPYIVFILISIYIYIYVYIYIYIYI